MKGGAIPPGQKWLEELPGYTSETVGYGIYTGSVNEVSNLAFLIQGGSLYALTGADNSVHWRYNSDRFRLEQISATGSESWTAGILSGAGLEGVLEAGGARSKADLSLSDITYRLDPA